MRAFRAVTSRAAVLDRADVDTDQIMPKQFLKRIERTGFSEFLFFDWAKDPGFSSTVRRPRARRSSSRGATSAAALRASTRPGACRSTGSR